MKQREIKFRAWDKKEKKMIFDGLEDETIFSFPYRDLSNNLILMQFTGLLDKNGKEIYEGDIVNYDNKSFHNGLNGLVEWVGSGFYIAKHIPIFKIVEKFKDFEVIGNIYENPELLKK